MRSIAVWLGSLPSRRSVTRMSESHEDRRRAEAPPKSSDVRHEELMDGGITVIRLTGAVDLTSERRLRAELSAAAGDPSRRVVLDLRGVTFIDSSGLAVIAHADLQFRRQGRVMACVVRDDGPVRRLLKATGIDAELLLFAGLDSAASHVLRTASSQGARGD